MNEALRILRMDVLPKSARLFALLAEGPLAEIERLRLQIVQQAQALSPAMLEDT